MRRSNGGLKTRRRQYRQSREVEARSEGVAGVETGVEAEVEAAVRCRKSLVAPIYNSRRRSQRGDVARRVAPCRCR
jgi:hypothetical protein